MRSIIVELWFFTTRKASYYLRDLLTVCFRRPTHIMDQNWDVRPLEVDDFPETANDENDEEGSAEVEKGRLIFVNLISLTEILSDIIDAFYTLKASKRSESTMKALERAKPLQIRLKTWYSTLQPLLSIDENRSRKLSSTGKSQTNAFIPEISIWLFIIVVLICFRISSSCLLYTGSYSAPGNRSIT